MQIHVEKPGVKGALALGTGWRVIPSDELLYKLRERFGSSSVALLYQSTSPGAAFDHQ